MNNKLALKESLTDYTPQGPMPDPRHGFRLLSEEEVLVRRRTFNAMRARNIPVTEKTWPFVPAGKYTTEGWQRDNRLRRGLRDAWYRLPAVFPPHYCKGNVPQVLVDDIAAIIEEVRLMLKQRGTDRRKEAGPTVARNLAVLRKWLVEP